VIFFIYLYQKYIYKIDPKRVNEFGVSQEMLEENGAAKAIGDSPDEKGDNAADGDEASKGNNSNEELTDKGDKSGEIPAEPKSLKEKKND